MKVVFVMAAIALLVLGSAAWAQDEEIPATGPAVVDEHGPSDQAAVLRRQIEQMQNTIDEMKQKLDMLDAVVTDPEGKVETVISDVGKIKKAAFSGYAQIRYEWADEKEDGGLFTDSFNVRRARLKLTATPTDRSSAVLQLEMAGNKTSVKDVYLTHKLTQQVQAAIGQQNWWFGYEVPYSSSRREAPERALIFRRLFTGERDRGLVLNFTGAKAVGQFGIYDGTGIESSISGDFDQRKDLLAHVLWSIKDAEFGLSAYHGKGVLNSGRTATVANDKDRYGAEFRYFGEDWTFKSEWVRGRGVDTAPTVTDWVSGGYAQFGYNTNVKNTLVAKYSTMSKDPIKPAFGRRTAWDLGFLRWLDSNLRLKLFYTINKEDTGSISNNMLRTELLVTY